MKLNVTKRDPRIKGDRKRLRREGQIPAVMYHNGKPGETISVSDDEYQALVRHLKPGHLSTQRIELVAGEDKPKNCLIKEIQYHPTSYRVLHIDFEELDKDVQVNVKVPIECTGVIDCVGVKLGGVLRQVIRHLPIRCLPEHIPNEFAVNVSAMDLGHSRRLRDLTIPNTVRPLMNLKEVAIVVAKR